MPNDAVNSLSSKTLGEQLRDALNLYGRHLPWCQKLAQMPMESGRTYMHPTDWDNWLATQPCTCKWDEVANTLLRSSDETGAFKPYCRACQSVGMSHCSDPINCGQVVWEPPGLPQKANERLAGCRNWKPKHGVGPYCGNCGFHENEHADLHR